MNCLAEAPGQIYRSSYAYCQSRLRQGAAA